MTRTLPRLRSLVGWPLLSAFAVLLVCIFFVPPTYTASALIDVRPSARGWGDGTLPPQMPTGAQYGALLQSRRIADRVIAAFDLQTVYEERTLDGARRRLAQAVQVGGNKGGQLIVRASDRYAWRAADLANQYVRELQLLLDELRVEAAHARADRLHASEVDATQRLLVAHERLAGSRLDGGTLSLVPAVSAGIYGQVRQALDAAERRVQVLRTSRQDGSADVQQALARAEALRVQLRRIEAGEGTRTAQDRLGYADALREVRLLDPLVKLLRTQAMQAEMDAGLRVESLVSVDAATIPERPSGPLALLYMAAAWLATVAWLCLRAWHRHGSAPWQRRYRRSGGVPASAATSRA